MEHVYLFVSICAFKYLRGLIVDWLAVFPGNHCLHCLQIPGIRFQHQVLTPCNRHSNQSFSLRFNIENRDLNQGKKQIQSNTQSDN